MATDVETSDITNEEADDQPENGIPEENTQGEYVPETDNSTDVTVSKGSEVTENNSTREQTPNLPEFVYSSSLDVYSISKETYLRTGGKTGDLNQLYSDEYYSLVLHMQYNGQGSFDWSEFCVRVDGGEAWYWTAGSLPSGYSMDMHIYYSNMQYMSVGNHTATWYIDGREVYSDTFLISEDLNWAALTNLPTKDEIAACNSAAAGRSPYMCAWLTIPSGTRYREYTIEFKSDYFPRGSYYALGNWYMDYPELERQYASVRTEYGISGYAGFQNIHDGSHLGIMSFWDAYCTDASGNTTTVRARPIYPENPYKAGEFEGEGVGAQCMDYYDWKENHWYRVHLRCIDSTATGNTEVEFWVCDLETGEYTLICAYDLGTANVAFEGGIAIFLENYLNEYAGEIRTLEVRNAMYLEETSGQWKGITEANMIPNGSALSMDYIGSYDYGVEGNTLWIMTTGVGNTHDDSAGSYLYFGN